MDAKTEIRKLPAGNSFQLIQILEYDESWKRLMAIIPKFLSLDDFESKIAINNLPKYNTDHFKLIENAGTKFRKPCTEILFEEWGTSGKIRPRLGHLLRLLERAELYRAADYVAVDLLNAVPPERPKTGPAAKIDISIPDNLPTTTLNNIHLNIEQLLNDINYPSSDLNTQSTILTNNQHLQPAKRIIPKIVVNDVSNTDNRLQNLTSSSDQSPDLSTKSSNESTDPSLVWREAQIEKKIEKLRYSPGIPENLTESTNLSNSTGSDFIKFSDSSISDNQIPALSSLLNYSESSQSDIPSNETYNFDIPDIHELIKSENNIPNLSELNEGNDSSGNIPLPAFSQILDSDKIDNVNPALSQILNSDNVDNVNPAFGKILNSSKINNVNPAFSQILNSSKIDNVNSNPAFSQILNSDKIDNVNPNPAFSQILYSDKMNENPAFSQIMSTNNTETIPAFSQILQSNNLESFRNISSENFPNFNQLISKTDSENNQIPHLSALLENNSQNIPAENIINDLIPKLNFLQSQTSDKITSSSELTVVTRKQSLSPVSLNTRSTCVSPLPNLSLNTLLPHFTYTELENCTDNFDETLLNQHSFLESVPNGRKLGSGAFGCVYLATGLLEKPVAVKKLNLNGLNVVNVDDTITKQFRNEVELLCKYKHENLLSLLGYSCDGPTYCLIYEYVSGGALKDKLQSSENRLIWTNRLYIALGTAKAVSYLHNAYSTPLIHRDIKSANILLDNAEKPKLCDFGLIKLTPNQNTNTSTTVFGTSAYMAPEAFRGDVSAKLDTFSFGVVLLELLTGLPPLDENREGNDLVTHVEDVCENGIKPLLDQRAGSWTLKDVNFGDNLYKISTQCLEEKKKRPLMFDVVKQLSQLIDRAN